MTGAEVEATGEFSPALEAGELVGTTAGTLEALVDMIGEFSLALVVATGAETG